MPTVRTTLRPDVEIEVNDADYIDLQRQGLLVEETTQPSASPAATTTKKAAPPATIKES